MEMERTAQTEPNAKEPACFGLVFDARDINCTACLASALCMFDFYNKVIRPKIDEVGSDKPYFDLTNFELVTDTRIAEMLASGILDDNDIVEDIMYNCKSTRILAEYRLKIIKAKLAYESSISK